MDFNNVLLLLTPFWLAMLFINGKVMVEINKEWNSDKKEQVKPAMKQN